MTDLKPSTDKMLASFSESIWKHFGAAIDMFENAVVMCPEKLWGKPQFWYKAFHVSFWLDYYMTVNPEGFTPPAFQSNFSIFPVSAIAYRKRNGPCINGRGKCTPSSHG